MPGGARSAGARKSPAHKRVSQPWERANRRPFGSQRSQPQPHTHCYHTLQDPVFVRPSYLQSFVVFATFSLWEMLSASDCPRVFRAAVSHVVVSPLHLENHRKTLNLAYTCRSSLVIVIHCESHFGPIAVLIQGFIRTISIHFYGF